MGLATVRGRKIKSSMLVTRTATLHMLLEERMESSALFVELVWRANAAPEVIYIQHSKYFKILA